MMEVNEEPIFQSPDFRCPRCAHYSQQQWFQAYDTSQTPNLTALSFLFTSKCLRCKQRAIWLDGVMIYPPALSKAPPMSNYTPALIRVDIEEAQAVLSISPRAACALLRLATEKLCREIIGEDITFNKAVDKLVEQGISLDIQQALDVIRVTGNSAVHPGQLADEDTESQALFMFELLNVIVDEKIGLKQRLQKAVAAMPAGVRLNIEDRSKRSVKEGNNA